MFPGLEQTQLQRVGVEAAGGWSSPFPAISGMVGTTTEAGLVGPQSRTGSVLWLTLPGGAVGRALPQASVSSVVLVSETESGSISAAPFVLKDTRRQDKLPQTVTTTGAGTG